ncbi:short-chain dehydrogenase [Idiomarina tyrosinivorans]|uniref:Short-chain dehydrogenase n=1 Tax=Idiomarina tyrosinivorans TaxID=1445662 RepID=A0A432ZQ37_9GAMM|nr:SDR family NAD(P)-dependent oxidoreductase [Idiomarina tyrosinivorans]RUO79936.1 short-chain dehydrogenase [Idiomarina tyrosinivorans]
MAIIIFGAAGGLGQALTQALQQSTDETVVAISRRQPQQQLDGVDYLAVDDYQSAKLAQWIADYDATAEPITGVISTIGVLHDGTIEPEKNLQALAADKLAHSFYVNASLPLLLLKQFLPKLDRKRTRFWVQLSAKVGSISDNYLGGWYGYRASKAALNMMLKSASIELGRTHKQLCVAAIHPGTTDTALSKPFQKHVAKDKLYSPEQSAARIMAVIAKLSPEQSGKLWHWDGTELPY